jgi:ribosomal protein S11
MKANFRKVEENITKVKPIVENNPDNSLFNLRLTKLCEKRKIKKNQGKSFFHIYQKKRCAFEKNPKHQGSGKSFQFRVKEGVPTLNIQDLELLYRLYQKRGEDRRKEEVKKKMRSMRVLVRRRNRFIVVSRRFQKKFPNFRHVLRFLRKASSDKKSEKRVEMAIKLGCSCMIFGLANDRFIRLRQIIRANRIKNKSLSTYTAFNKLRSSVRIFSNVWLKAFSKFFKSGSNFAKSKNPKDFKFSIKNYLYHSLDRKITRKIPGIGRGGKKSLALSIYSALNPFQVKFKPFNIRITPPTKPLPRSFLYNKLIGVSPLIKKKSTFLTFPIKKRIPNHFYYIKQFLNSDDYDEKFVSVKRNLMFSLKSYRRAAKYRRKYQQAKRLYKYKRMYTRFQFFNSRQTFRKFRGAFVIRKNRYIHSPFLGLFSKFGRNYYKLRKKRIKFFKFFKKYYRLFNYYTGKKTKNSKNSFRKKFKIKHYLHIFKSVNNVFVNLTAPKGRSLFCYSAGRTFFKGSKRLSPIALETMGKIISKTFKASKVYKIFIVFHCRVDFRCRSLMRGMSKNVAFSGFSYYLNKPHNGLRKRSTRRV